MHSHKGFSNLNNLTRNVKRWHSIPLTIANLHRVPHWNSSFNTLWNFARATEISPWDSWSEKCFSHLQSSSTHLGSFSLPLLSKIPCIRVWHTGNRSIITSDTPTGLQSVRSNIYNEFYTVHTNSPVCRKESNLTLLTLSSFNAVLILRL